MKISMIGAGNVAWHLSIALEDHHHQVCEVYSRKQVKARALVSMLYQAKVKTDLDFSESAAEVFILAVADDAIAEVCSMLVLPENAILVHTSGTKSLEDLQNLMIAHHDLPVRCGVFYPLMTFSIQKKMSLKEVPFCIEAEEASAEDKLVQLAQSVSNTVYLISSRERKVLHVAAVFACNFTNHLLALANEITTEENLEFELLKPLIKETFQKALLADHPADVQTGPAIRGDKSTINTHLLYLNNQPDLFEIYEVMSESIRKWHS
ncbi:Rossmann-like and DUF2520 domain-containing protein [Emticicia sp. 21SJ11W-3]|uniref:Rossmann-like and DUF2520 domain-containing protein n=1 Tax=Emticicia sp. 21SJ11W-3 TaxID=2916755 RepID=UPI00209C7E58|nr:Rossmann-like and DUF2520 domain-containing protein [Emticicia sp. 21SJ11W-3]UTA68195.1 F420-dependent NADP oxidoreductase [Emticicia sp. 21SJ11W-3]